MTVRGLQSSVKTVKHGHYIYSSHAFILKEGGVRNFDQKILNVETFLNILVCKFAHYNRYSYMCKETSTWFSGSLRLIEKALRKLDSLLGLASLAFPETDLSFA